MYQLTRLLVQRSFPSGSGILTDLNFRLTGLLVLQTAIPSLLVVACATAAAPNPSAPLPAESKVNVVATTTVLADMARNVGGDLVEVSSIVPPGADVHSFQTSPSHSVSIGQAKVIISNGSGLDDSLNPVLASAKRADAFHLVTSQGLSPEPLQEMELPAEGTESKHHDVGEEHRDDEHGQAHASGDPHFWLDPILAIHYVERIREGLVQADPANAQAYSTNADRYIQEIRDLDREIAHTLSQVPPEHRHLVTFHDAYGYFGPRYGWKVSAFVPSDASDVTPGAIVRVINQIRSEGIPAVFVEPQFNADVLKEAVRDTGIKVGVIRSLADDTAPTYLALMRANAKSLAENLR